MVALLLLPGLDGTGLLFEEFAASLGSDVEVIVASYPAERPLSYTELESIARRYIPSDKSFFLLGESFSGPIALSIAASSPPGLLGVILCCSFARNPLPLLTPARSLVRLFPVKSLPISLLSFFLMGRFSTERLRVRLAGALARVIPEVLQSRAYATLTVDASAALRRVKVPLLYLRASEDRVVGKSAAEWILSQASDARMIEYAAPHFLLQVLPRETAAAVGKFIMVQTKKTP